MTAPVAGAVNVMAPPYFSPETYRSDSNQHWRSGCPHDELRAGAFPWLQLLVHPEIWVYDGGTMGETMRSMLDAERDRRVEQLARGQDRPFVKPITVLVRPRVRPAPPLCSARCARTASARSASSGRTCPSARSARHLCDAFHLVPAGSDPGFRGRDPRGRRARGRRRRPASVVVRPAGARGDTASASPCPCSSRGPETIRRSNDKAETYALLHRLGVPAPAVPARARRGGRSRPRRASSATRSGPSASSRCSRPARAASGSSTRPSTARTSSCTSGPGSVAMRLEEARRAAAGRGRPPSCS